MKTIRLYAYLWNNLGDDLMVRALLEHYPQYCFFVDHPNKASEKLLAYSNFWNEEKLYRRYGRINHLINIITLNKRKDLFIRYILKRMNKKRCCSVQVGGSIFIPQASVTIEQQIENERKKLEDAPFFIIGANFESDMSDEYIEAYRHFFKDCAGVSFRDKTSYELFEELPHVQFAPDIVFSYTADDATERDNTVLISVIDLRSRSFLSQYAKEYEQYIANVCIAVTKKGMTPILMSFCSAEGDENAIKAICELLPESIGKRVKIVYYQGDFTEVLNMYAKASFIVATRFHAMVLALCYHKPFFSISYSKKIENVLKDMGCDNYCAITDLSTIDINEKLCHLHDSVVDVVKKKAQMQFRQLDEFINK